MGETNTKMKMKELFKNKSMWTKGALARDKNKDVISPISSDACSWCLKGGLMKCYQDEVIFDKIQMCILKYIQEKYPSFSNLPNWNDATRRTFEDVSKLVQELDI